MHNGEQADATLIPLVVHELRAPLTAIRGYLDIAAVAETEDALLLALDRAQESVVRMSGMLSQLAAADAPRDLFEPATIEPVSLGVLAEDVATDLRASSDRHINVSAADDTEVRGDRDRLRQVIENLLVNATLHTAPDSAIDVSVTAHDGHVVLAVEDRGPGIPEHALDGVFEPYARIDVGTGPPKGFGLGLYIVREIVLAHGGTVRAEPREPGPGARFVVTLPRAADVAP